MAVLEWDKVGERFYETGVDRGVLYLKDGTVAAWNGITSIDEGSDAEVKAVYMDGVKISQSATPGDFVGKLSALTYPEEFDRVLGIVEPSNPGLEFYEQPPQSFGLSYRTKIGNDLDGDDYGYKVHILYNVLAIPDSYKFETVKNPAAPAEFSWSLSARPDLFQNYRPTAHVAIDSTRAFPASLQSIEDTLYGTETTDPRLPSITEVGSIFGAFGSLTITDNGDGTWTADDPTNTYITMLNPTTFQIEHASTVYLDPDTYEISSTNL